VNKCTPSCTHSYYELGEQIIVAASYPLHSHMHVDKRQHSHDDTNMMATSSPLEHGCCNRRDPSWTRAIVIEVE
jgi:hypothetical protein